jgi:hypothetical protein
MAADVNSNLASWSTSESSNAPAGSTAISTNLDDNLRQIQATVRTYLATKASDIASATTTDLSGVAGNFVDITGTTTITGFGTLSAGMWKVLQFDGALTLTHNATSLILPTGSSITTAAGDCLFAYSLGSGNWIVPFYQQAGVRDGAPIVYGSADATKKVRIEVDGLTTATTRVMTAPDRDITIADVLDSHGRCRLAKSGSNLVLSPFNGNTLVINSAIYEIPDAGVSLAPSGLTISTAYYIYAYMNSGTMTLEQSTTAYAAQAGTGVAIKSGDATRTLVGMEYATGATTWAGYCRSWFNDPGYTATGVLTADRTTSSATFAEINSEIRTNFLSWTGEIVQTALRANVSSNTGGSSNIVGLSFDGGTAEDGSISGQTTSIAGDVNISKNASGVWHKSGLSEGFHYATLFVKTSSGTTTVRGGSNPDRTVLSVFLKA